MYFLIHDTGARCIDYAFTFQGMNKLIQPFIVLPEVFILFLFIWSSIAYIYNFTFSSYVLVLMFNYWKVASS